MDTQCAELLPLSMQSEISEFREFDKTAVRPRQAALHNHPSVRYRVIDMVPLETGLHQVPNEKIQPCDNERQRQPGQPPHGVTVRHGNPQNLPVAAYRKENQSEDRMPPMAESITTRCGSRLPANGFSILKAKCADHSTPFDRARRLAAVRPSLLLGSVSTINRYNDIPPSASP